MLDILLFRAENGGEPEMVRESQRRRLADPAVVDRIIELDAVWRAAQSRAGQLQKELAAAKKVFASNRKARADTDGSSSTSARDAIKQLGSQVATAERAEGAAHAELQVTSSASPSGQLV